jgi:hypothetical protein
MQAAERERRMLGLQSDSAMLFSTAPRQFTFWLGKVQRMIRVLSRKRADLREPVDLDSYEGDIYIIAQWYTACRELPPGGDVHSVYRFDTVDLQAYNIKHVITPLELPCRVVSPAGAQRVFEYELRTGDKAAIDRAIADVAGVGSTPSDFSASRLASQQMADDGLTRAVVQSGYTGRQRSQLQY